MIHVCGFFLYINARNSIIPNCYSLLSIKMKIPYGEELFHGLAGIHHVYWECKMCKVDFGIKRQMIQYFWRERNTELRIWHQWSAKLVEDSSEHLGSSRHAQAGPMCPLRGSDVLWSCDGIGHHGNADHGRNMQIWFEVIDLETKGKESTCDQLRNNNEVLHRELGDN